MRLNELVSLNDVLKSSQYLKLLQGLSTKIRPGLNITKVKNQVLKSWKKGLKKRKHYDDLLSQVNVSLSDLIDK